MVHVAIISERAQQASRDAQVHLARATGSSPEDVVETGFEFPNKRPIHFGAHSMELVANLAAAVVSLQERVEALEESGKKSEGKKKK